MPNHTFILSGNKTNIPSLSSIFADAIKDIKRPSAAQVLELGQRYMEKHEHPLGDPVTWKEGL